MQVHFDSYQRFIPEFDAFQESLRKAFPLYLRANRLKIKPDELAERLRKQGIEAKPVLTKGETVFLTQDIKNPGTLPEYFMGYIHPQTLTSCLTTLFLGVSKQSYVLDMCASPGGKTSQIAQHMDNTGLVVANELYADRHIPLADTLSRLGVLNAVITAYQAQEFPLRTRFEKILADVPCSGEGRFRATRHPPIHQKRRGRARLPQLQKKIIIRGFDLLIEGGGDDLFHMHL